MGECQTLLKKIRAIHSINEEIAKRIQEKKVVLRDFHYQVLQKEDQIPSFSLNTAKEPNQKFGFGIPEQVQIPSFSLNTTFQTTQGLKIDTMFIFFNISKK